MRKSRFGGTGSLIAWALMLLLLSVFNLDPRLPMQAAGEHEAGDEEWLQAEQQSDVSMVRRKVNPARSDSNWRPGGREYIHVLGAV